MCPAPVSPSHPPRPSPALRSNSCVPSLPSLHPGPTPDPDAPLSQKTGPLLNLQPHGKQIAAAPRSAGTQGPHLQHGGANAHQESVARVPEGHPPPLSQVLSPAQPLPGWPAHPGCPTSRLDLLSTWDKVDIPHHRGPGPRGSAWHQMSAQVCLANSLGVGEAEALHTLLTSSGPR